MIIGTRNVKTAHLESKLHMPLVIARSVITKVLNNSIRFTRVGRRLWKE